MVVTPFGISISTREEQFMKTNLEMLGGYVKELREAQKEEAEED